MAIRTVAVLADDEPTITVETGPPVATDTQRQTRSQTRKKREELSSTLKSKPAHASLYHKMHEWQDKLDVAADAWVFDNIKEPIEEFIQEPDLPAYYKMVALLVRCLPDPEPEPEQGVEEEEEEKEEEEDQTDVEMDEERKRFMAEAKQAYEECLVVYTRVWDRESVEEAWSTWPN